MKHAKLRWTDGAWAAFGQVGSALGALATVRLLTEILAPQAYGLVTLLLGVALLAQGALATPVLQGVLRHYADYQRRGEAPLLYAACRAVLARRTVAVAAAALLLAAAGARLFGLRPLDAGLVIALFLAETVRAFQMTKFNAERRQRQFAVWTVADAALRPLCAWLATLVGDPGVTAVLAGYIVGCTAISLALYAAHRGACALSSLPAPVSNAGLAAARHSLHTYSTPLVLLACIGWLNGMADRYVIGGQLGLGQAGLYVAVYGLVSRPFLMLGQIVEQTLRQPYYASIAASPAAAGRIFRRWLASVLAASVGCVAAIGVFRDVWADLLLGPAFREAANLMPLIACAYAVLAVSQVFERYHYAHMQPRLVIYMQSAGVATLCAGATLLIGPYGVRGAASALVMASSVQAMLGAAFMLRRPNAASA